MPKDGNTPAPAPHAREPRERDAIQTPVGSQDTHLEQLCELHTKLREEQEQLQQLQHILEQKAIGRAPD
jgi:hypothetical protein